MWAGTCPRLSGGCHPIGKRDQVQGAGAGALRESSFLLAWWQSLPWLGVVLGLRGWNSTSELALLLLQCMHTCVMAMAGSTLVRGGVSAQGVRTPPLGWLALSLVHSHTCNCGGSLCLGQRWGCGQGVGISPLSWLSFFPSAYMCVGNGSLHLNGEWCQFRWDWSGILVQTGVYPGVSWQAGQSTSFQSAGLCWDWEQICVCSSEWSLSFLQPSSKPQWSSNQLRGLSS